MTVCNPWINKYQLIHLPYIALHFCDVWDAPVTRGTDPRGIKPTVLRHDGEQFTKQRNETKKKIKKAKINGQAC